MMNRKLLSTMLLAALALALSAQVPVDIAYYYQKAGGKSGRELKTALSHIIKNPSVVHYDSLWRAYSYTDMRPEGYLWDMYSSVTRYQDPMDKTMHKNSYEGSGINREHSMPQSWFGGMKPAYSDLVHVIPTDGWLNNMRSDYPYGETESPVKGSEGGFSVLGPSSVEGYSGKVFEPNDEFKGDLARIYFYMATCYEESVADFNSPMFSGDSYTAYADWALPMLLRWAKDDPVSEKELLRNEMVYRLQGNRNPYVDYPGLEELVWGDRQEEPFSCDGSDDPREYVAVDASSCDITLNNSFFNTALNGSRTYYDRIPFVGQKNGVTVSYAFGEGVNMYCNSSQMRLYTGNTLTFQTDKDPITSIELNVVQNPENRVFTASTGVMDGYKWTGEACEVRLQLEYASKGVVRLNKAKVTVTPNSSIELVHMDGAVRDGYVYNLMGVRMDPNNLSPGVYIRNGRKFLVR